MACNLLTKGRGLDCTRSQGGVKNVYFAVRDTTALTIASSEVTDIEMGSNKIYKYAIERGAASVTETIVGSTENGTVYYTPSITFQLNKLSKEDQNELKALTQSKLIVFAELYQQMSSTNTHNKILCLGAENGMRLNSGTDLTGMAWGDRNRYEWTLDGMEVDPMSFVADYTTTPFDNSAFTTGGIVSS